jgi:23S rRNA (guanine745-N1)-methyltransferase
MVALSIRRDESAIMVWMCPHCAQPLEARESGLSCVNGHRFDRAREGYVNLLPVQHKRSKNPGDNSEMVRGRRALHQAQLYRPLAEVLCDLVATCTDASRLLDIGCGEGYYDGMLSARLPELSVYGVDIAKTAVRLAARDYPCHDYAVASSRNLPVMTSSIDLGMCIFSPVNDSEVARAVRPNGYYLEVGPAAQHLWELKTALYEQPREHSLLRRAIPGGALLQEGESHYEKQLTQTELQAVLAATPFAFRGHREKREGLREQSDFVITLGFSWRLFRLAAERDTVASGAVLGAALESTDL